MKPWRLDQRPVVYDGHLSLAISRLRTNTALAKQVAALANEVGQPLPSPRASLPGDPWKLRGIPALGGRGSAGGAIRGSLPHIDGLRDRTLQALAVLVRDDGNGVSPGTDPLQALLDAEAETMRRLGAKSELGVDEVR